MDKESGDEDVGRTTDGQSDLDDREIPNGAVMALGHLFFLGLSSSLRVM